MVSLLIALLVLINLGTLYLALRFRREAKYWRQEAEYWREMEAEARATIEDIYKEKRDLERKLKDYLKPR